MRKKIVAGNWKMNNDLAETELFLVELKKQVFPENVIVMIAPPFTSLNQAFKSLHEHPVTVVAQNMHQSKEGAFTGEISAKMLKSVGVETVIVGHSERRAFFNEDSAVLAEKVNTALENEMTVIFCIGEEIYDRKNGNHFELIKKQLMEGLFHVSDKSWENLVIAYEPVWAIGTGETATPEQAQEMHKFIRKTIAENYSKNIAINVSILYGGSVKPDNATEIFGQADVDGGLIGGAALKVESFMNIVNSF
ncbi:triosephosphate isomerase [Aequorivita sublithincola DSM 14238]|uniref:Triosephosphate isomerase n=1 Tax=Aequorivita sublithincola (strain DSM 14238 / LMG 21431 / ACAM 643 / 9-3) TaxID=746697 RepID=I3YSG4_AEQSU|nr:triose-phosphate isomerase [Aequorivita sublithincola]AFL79932.1 triosephosphate isomerase [Aequorivita sublithincola DSM 14238]